jgi:hypothetical protein
MNRPEAIEYAKFMVDHLKGMDSESRDWKCIHALLVIVAQQEQRLAEFRKAIEQARASVIAEYSSQRVWEVNFPLCEAALATDAII